MRLRRYKRHVRGCLIETKSNSKPTVLDFFFDISENLESKLTESVERLNVVDRDATSAEQPRTVFEQILQTYFIRIFVVNKEDMSSSTTIKEIVPADK